MWQISQLPRTPHPPPWAASPLVWLQKSRSHHKVEVFIAGCCCAAAAVSCEQGRAGSEVWLRATDKRLCLYCGRRTEALIRFLQLGEASEDKKRSLVLQKGRRSSSSAAATAGSLKEKNSQTGPLEKVKKKMCLQTISA